MASITTRAGKGSPLTNAELDANFTNINAGITTAAAITGGTITGVSIDSAPIGNTTPSTGAFTSIVSTSPSGVLTRAAATQDGVQIAGRAGGTSSYEVTLTPTTLTADRTLTLPNNSGTVLTTGAVVTVPQGGTGLTSISSSRIPYATGTDTLGTSTGLTFNGTTFSANAISSSSSLTVTGAVTFNASSSAIQISPTQATATITIGGTTSATGTITLGQSTVSQTTNIQAGATASGSTKTINIGTGGLSGSTTTMAIGSTNGTTVTANGTWNYSSDASFTGTGQVKLPAGTTAQRSGSPATGMLRYNTSLSSFEGYNGTAWGGIGGAQAGGAIVTNKSVASVSYTIASGENGMSVGPVTINSGVTVTVSSGQRWLVL